MTNEVWLPPETAPKDRMILGDVGYPWAVVMRWNECMDEWVLAGMSTNTAEGEDDPYFETEHARKAELIGWQELPKVPLRSLQRPTRGTIEEAHG